MRQLYWLFSFVAAIGCVMYVKSAPQEVRTGSWLSSGAMAQARTGASAVRLPDGRVLITGGTGVNGALSTAELYGQTGSFAQVAQMIHARSQHVSVALDDGRVLIAGGKTTQDDTALNSAELYDPRANTWVNAA